MKLKLLILKGEEWRPLCSRGAQAGIEPATPGLGNLS